MTRAAVLPAGNHGAAEALGPVRRVAARAGVELVDPDGSPELAIVLGGDGSMLRALARFLGTGVPVLGVNFGRVGFLTAVPGAELEQGLARALAGDYRTVALGTLEVEVDGRRHAAVNDVVVAGGTLGRMVELGCSIGGEELGSQPCDGLIAATPAGSTAYNLSNGGPVLVWGLDALVLTYVAPHALAIRPLVVPRGPDVVVTNLTVDLETAVLVDGQQVATLPPHGRATIAVGSTPSLLATLPEVTFFTRYAATFGH